MKVQEVILRATAKKITCETIVAPTPVVSPQIVGVAAKAG